MTKEERLEKRVAIGYIELFPDIPDRTDWCDLDAFMDVMRVYLAGEVERIAQPTPVTYRKRIELRWSAGDHDQEMPPSLTVLEVRDETSEEMTKRIRRRDARQRRQKDKEAAQEAEERKLLAELKAKYEG